MHFGYNGHLGPPLSGHYIQLATISDLNIIEQGGHYIHSDIVATFPGTKYSMYFVPGKVARKSGHYIRMATINVAIISGVHCTRLTKPCSHVDKRHFLVMIQAPGIPPSLTFTTLSEGLRYRWPKSETL